MNKVFAFLYTLFVAGSALATGPYLPNQEIDLAFCSTTTCNDTLVGMSHQFIDVAAVHETGNLRSCACYIQEDANEVVSHEGDTTIVDSNGDIWVVALVYAGDTLCAGGVPPNSGSFDHIRIRRFNSNGTVDTNWASTAKGLDLNLPTASGTVSIMLNAVVDSSQNIYVAVLQINGSTNTVVIQKWDSTGNIVTGFGASGVKSINTGDFPSLINFPDQSLNITNSLGITKDATAEKLMLFGVSNDNTSPYTNSGFWAVRMNLSGAYDTSFGEYSGAEKFTKALFGGATNDDPRGNAAVQYIVGGNPHLAVGVPVGGTTNMWLAKLQSASTSCATPATCLISIPSITTGFAANSSWSLSGLSYNSTDNKIAAILDGLNNLGTIHYIEIAKFSTAGVLDTGFNTTGRYDFVKIQGSAITADQSSRNHILDTSTGAVYVDVPMSDVITPVPNHRGVVIKFTAAGARDTTFGTGSGEFLSGTCNGENMFTSTHTISGFTPVLAMSCNSYADVDETLSQYCGEP